MSRRQVLIVVAAAVAGCGSLSYALYWPTARHARARIAAGARTVASRCGPIEYAERGAGPPVLVVHGAGGGFDQGLELGDGLARAGFRVIAPSRFGYLGTPVPADASAEAQAQAHACLLDALNVPRVAVMGVSAGGPSALLFARRFPERTKALVLLVPAVYATRTGSPPPARASGATIFLMDAALRSDFLFWAAGKLAHRTFARAVLGTPTEVLASASPAEQARLAAILDDILPVSRRRAGLLNDAKVLSSPARYELEKISAPTLAISAADDLYGTYEGARYTAQHVPNARFIGYPTGGHMLVGHDAAVSAEVLALLQRAER